MVFSLTIWIRDWPHESSKIILMHLMTWQFSSSILWIPCNPDKLTTLAPPIQRIDRVQANDQMADWPLSFTLSGRILFQFSPSVVRSRCVRFWKSEWSSPPLPKCLPNPINFSVNDDDCGKSVAKSCGADRHTGFSLEPAACGDLNEKVARKYEVLMRIQQKGLREITFACVRGARSHNLTWE